MLLNDVVLIAKNHWTIYYKLNQLGKLVLENSGISAYPCTGTNTVQLWKNV